MLKFQQQPTPEDIKVAANIERKRQLEEERKLRIFNPRYRKIGVRIKRHLFRQLRSTSATSAISSLIFYPRRRIRFVSLSRRSAIFIPPREAFNLAKFPYRSKRKTLNRSTVRLRFPSELTLHLELSSRVSLNEEANSAGRLAFSEAESA